MKTKMLDVLRTLGPILSALSAIVSLLRAVGLI